MTTRRHTVAVVTDGAAALPGPVVEDLGVRVVPLSVTVGGRPVEAGELSDAELAVRPDVSSAAPSPGAFAEAIAASPAPAGVVVVTVAAGLSATHRAAQLGAELAGVPAVVVDSASAAGGQALVVHAAAVAAGTGAGLEDVAAVARSVAGRVRLAGALTGLEQLVRSGRIPPVAGRAGHVLGLRPMFELRAGAIHRLRPARSDTSADARLVDRWRRSRPSPGARLHVAAVHAGAPERADRLLRAVTHEVPEPATLLVGGFGPALVVNCGVGVGGLAWWWEEERG